MGAVVLLIVTRVWVVGEGTMTLRRQCRKRLKQNSKAEASGEGAER
jgi:hypothetical protein